MSGTDQPGGPRRGGEPPAEWTSRDGQTDSVGEGGPTGSPPPPPPSSEREVPAAPPPSAEEMRGRGSDHPSLAKRFGARFLDGIILTIAWLLIGFVLGGFGDVGVAGSALLNLVGSLVGLGYYVGFESSTGATPGKRILSMSVVDVSGQGHISVEQSVKRNWWLLLGLIPIVGGLASLGVAIYIAVTINSDPRGQGWHDRIADALVVGDTSGR